jgi:hypothetical protein
MTVKTVLSQHTVMETISTVTHCYAPRLIKIFSQGNCVFSKETEKSVHKHVFTFKVPCSILKQNKVKETYVR